MSIRRVFFAALLLMLYHALPGQAPEAVSPEPFRFFDLKPNFRTWGAKADAILGFRLLPENDSSVWMRLGAALGTGHYYRLGDGSIYQLADNPGNPPINPSETDFLRYNMYWGLGLMQGLHFDASKDRDDLNLLLSYRGWWDENHFEGQPTDLLYRSSSVEKQRAVTNSLQLDLFYDGTQTDSVSKVKQGVIVDLSIEYAPSGVSVPTTTNFAQYSLSARGFLPLYQSVSPEGWNLLSLYLAGNVAIDYIQGFGNDALAGIPIHVSQRFGGKNYQYGLGGLLRGLCDGYYDGRFKIVANLELRANLPALFDKGIVPGILLYTDAGYFSDPPGLTGASGFASSVGIGIYGTAFDFGSGAIYTNFLLNQADHQDRRWVPIVFEFGLHF